MLAIKSEALLKNQPGFTLFELIIVIVILGILASVAIPKYVDVRGRTADLTNQANGQAIKNVIILHYAKNVLINTAYSIDDAVNDYNAGPSGFFFNGQIPQTADHQDFTVAVIANQISVTY
jgi:MSHA pilin protein MshA